MRGRRRPDRAMTDPDSPPQFGLFRLLLLWTAAAVPMPILAFWIAPRISAASALHPGIVLWLCLIAGMAWQGTLAIAMLWREARRDSGRLTWRQRIWWQMPLRPSGVPDRWLLVGLAPVIALTALVELTPVADWLAAPLLWIWPALAEVPAPALDSLADPTFIGAWWLLGLWALSFAFNYFLGEELFFRGLLLPRMRGVFGRWDWLANGAFFGLYHLIRPLTIPSIIVSGAIWAFPCARYRSAVYAVVPHAVEGIFVLLLVLGVVTGQIP